MRRTNSANNSLDISTTPLTDPGEHSSYNESVFYLTKILDLQLCEAALSLPN